MITCTRSSERIFNPMRYSDIIISTELPIFLIQLSPCQHYCTYTVYVRNLTLIVSTLLHVYRGGIFYGAHNTCPRLYISWLQSSPLHTWVFLHLEPKRNMKKTEQLYFYLSNSSISQDHRLDILSNSSISPDHRLDFLLNMLFWLHINN